MIIPPTVDRKHRLVRPYIDLVAKKVREAVQTYCERNGFAYVGRIKGIESLAEKIESGRFRSWGELDDLFACAVIIPTLAEEAEVIEWLGRAFSVVQLRHRGTTRKDPSTFRFDATRFCGTLRREHYQESSPQVLSVKFEIQIRTAFEHAWSVTTHALAYKSNSVDWRTARLAAQMKAAVEQLDQLVMAFAHNAAVIIEHPWPELESRSKIDAFFREMMEAKDLPEEVVPLSWGRFCENVSSLIKASVPNGFQRDISQEVDRALEIVRDQTDSLAAETFPRSLSLFQVCLGSLARGGFIERPLHRFSPLVSAELVALYPECRVLGEGFDIEMAEAADEVGN